MMDSIVQVDTTPRKYPWNLVPESADNQERAKVVHMSQKWATIEDDLDKSELLFERWTKIDDFTRGSFRVVVAICLIMSTVVSVAAGTTAQWLPFVAAGLTAFGAVQETLVKLFITDFTTKKRKKYHDQVRIRRKYLDKMFLAYLDATVESSDQGKKISVDELKLYLGLTYEMDEKLMESSMEHQEILSHFLQSKLANIGDATMMKTPNQASAGATGAQAASSSGGNHQGSEGAIPSTSGTGGTTSMSAADSAGNQNGDEMHVGSETDPLLSTSDQRSYSS